jgi:biuret amidohydrolase
MRIDLAELAAPSHTAIVTQECQGAVVGPNAGLAVLAQEAQREALPNIERLLPTARGAGVKVVHCLVQRRPDGLGANHNAKIFAIGDGSDGEIAITPGTPGAELLPELGPAPTDLVLRRDAVAGIPTDYSKTIIDNMLSLLATITTTGDLIEVWNQP